MQNTKIDWTDMSWNPITGCLHNCPFCYARAMYKRFGRSFKPTIHYAKLQEPLSKRQPRKIFVCSVADLFGYWVPDEWINQVMNTIKRCPQHTFQFLTKNPSRLPKVKFTSNCWVGATANTQKMYDDAIKHLDKVDATIRFISAEPLHSSIVLNNPPLDWLIVGAQTGNKPMQPEKAWVDSIVSETRRLNLPLFFKENLKYEPHLTEWPKVTHGQLRLFG